MNEKEIKKLLSRLDEYQLPNKEKILSACSGVDICNEKGRKNRIRTFMIAAALIALLALVGCAVEVKEYNDAVTFFETNSLSTENLSRTEIKKVYRDIKTEKFELEQTAIVILDQYEGYVIGVTKPTPDELKQIWDQLGMQSDDSYSWYYLDNEIVVNEITHGGEMMFLKKENGKVLWESRIPLRDGYVEGYTLIDNEKYVVAYGVYSPMTGGTKHCGFLEIFDEKTGESVLRKIFDEYRFFSIAEVIGDGKNLVIFSRGDLEKFVFIKMDISGKILHKKETKIGNKGIWDVAEFDDGYIIQLGGYQQQEAIYKVLKDGEIGEGISYSSNETAYFICDMMEYEGKLYLSSYAVPKNGRDINTSHDEIIEILEKIRKEPGDKDITANNGGITNFGTIMNTKNLAEEMRANYTAVLLVCDKNDGIPTEFYSVEGSVCGDLSLNEQGEMLWETQYISDAYYSPATSSFSIGGACYVYRHTFDEKGDLINSERTGEVIGFRR